MTTSNTKSAYTAYTEALHALPEDSELRKAHKRLNSLRAYPQNTVRAPKSENTPNQN